MRIKDRRVSLSVILLLLVLCLAPVHAQAFTFIGSPVQTCAKGDSGYNVSRVKSRLQALGYYSDTATFDDEYNDIMVQRVKLFQENNSLEVTGEVDYWTANKLNESNPIRGEYYKGYWSEPDVTLIIPYSSWGKWNEKSNDQFTFAIKVKNVSTSRKIVATEFLVYTEDLWGDEIISSSYPYSYSVDTTFSPGEMKYIGYLNIPYRHSTNEVHIAINKVRYSDGSVEYVSSPEYWTWTINW